MSQIFRPRANVWAKLSVFGTIVVALVFILILVFLSRSPYPAFARKSPDQPVPFFHSIHVGAFKIDCRYCHTSVEVSASAGFPATQTCMTCHTQVLTQDERLAPVRQSWETGKPIEWNRVHDLGDFVYFNHSIHVAKGVGCSTCHGQIDQMNKVEQVQPLTMGWCLGCHREPEKYIRPTDQVYNMEWQPPADQVAQGQRLVQEYNIQVSKLQNCSICHR
jgi:hypothetical protein